MKLLPKGATPPTSFLHMFLPQALHWPRSLDASLKKTAPDSLGWRQLKARTGTTPLGLGGGQAVHTSSSSSSVNTLDWLKLFMKAYRGRDTVTIRASSRFLIQRWRLKGLVIISRDEGMQKAKVQWIFTCFGYKQIQERFGDGWMRSCPLVFLWPDRQHYLWIPFR